LVSSHRVLRLHGFELIPISGRSVLDRLAAIRAAIQGVVDERRAG
jgi:hypothetical protein